MKVILLICFMFFATWVRADDAIPGQMHWYRGNTHAHSVNNGGNVAPEVAVRWFREHGYHFVFLTEHEFLADVATLNALHGAKGKFVVMPGQEITQMLADPSHPDGIRQAHVNGLGINELVMPIGSERGETIATRGTLAELYVRNVQAVRKAGGIPQINHPNFRWSVRPEDLATLSGVFLMEIANAWPVSNNLGGIDDHGNVALSTEALWDRLLDEGKTVWGVGSDDSHDYVNLTDRHHEGPGKAWIMVRAPELKPTLIMDALLRGEFYASTGVTLKDYVVDANSISIVIEQPGPTSFSRVSDDRRFTTRFTGRGGQLLSEVRGMKPSYQFDGSESYVRATIVDSNGLQAWTQPVLLKSRRR
jgi:hypothetical protein